LFVYLIVSTSGFEMSCMFRMGFPINLLLRFVVYTFYSCEAYRVNVSVITFV